jgi:hypothetical protein
MTYQAGIGPGMESLGLRPDVPHVRCDGCGLRIDATTRDGNATAWLRGGKAPKGWRLDRDGDGRRWDTCPRCRAGQHKGEEKETGR